MKIKAILSTALLAAGVAIISTTANAATISAAADDLVLSFGVSSGITGSGNDVSYDLGNVTTFLTNNNNAQTNNLLNLSADLTSIFGASWNTLANLQWSVVGSDVNTDPLYYTVVVAGTPNPAPASAGVQNTGALPINTLRNYLNHKTITTSVGNGWSYASTQTNGYFNQLTAQGTTTQNFSYFNTSVQNAMPATSGTVLAKFYSSVATDNGGPAAAVLDGTFGLTGAGELTFTEAIPEPSTYVLMGVGSLALLFLFRRRGSARA